MKEKIKRRNLKKLEGDLSRVQMLLKEVMQQMTEEMAAEIIHAIRSGGEAGLILRENSRGIGYKIAFTVVPTEGKIVGFNLAHRVMNTKAFAVEKGGEA
jgi:hypothetical protein